MPSRGVDRAGRGHCKEGFAQRSDLSWALRGEKRVFLGGGSAGAKASIGRHRASLERPCLAWLELEASGEEQWERRVAGGRAIQRWLGPCLGRGLPTSPVPSGGQSLSRQSSVPESVVSASWP